MSETRDWRFVAFLASATAAGIHFGATPEHMHEYLPAGIFMLAAALLQLGWALCVTRSTGTPLMAAGIAGNLALAGTWLVSRTAGLPWGEMPGAPEHIDGPDAVATALEILVVVAAVRLRNTGTGEAPAPGILLRLAWVGALSACILAAHDPGREQLAVVATLANAAALRVYLRERGSHETYRRRYYVRRTLDARAGFEPSG